ncbi:MAG: DUF805 domain-containing protein [Pseudomonadota bacterium]
MAVGNGLKNYKQASYPIDHSLGPGFLGYIRKNLNPWNWLYFSGRAQRAEIWSLLGLIAIVMAVSLTIAKVTLPSEAQTFHVISLATIVPTIPLAIPFWVTMVRRAHDIGLPGWGIIFTAILLIIPSQQGKNAYGHHPKSLILEHDRSDDVPKEHYKD